ncbi:MAG: hypothetical protein R2795_22075 [Saprospiraceae bacterium]
MKFLLLLSSLLLAATQCQKEDLFEWEAPFELAVGEAKVHRDSKTVLQWVSVKEDSRCPKNTACVWEGQAVLSLSLNETPFELTLRKGKPDQAKTLVGAYVVEATTLTPYPEGNKIPTASYRLTLVVKPL